MVVLNRNAADALQELSKSNMEKAKRHLKVADHLIYMTYPMIRDNKLLLAVMENTFLSMVSAMKALLYYGREHKNVPLFSEQLDSLIYWFRLKCLNEYKISNDGLILIEDLKSLLSEHSKSTMEFSRKDSLIIYTDTFRFKQISVQQMKDYVAAAKNFFSQIEKAIA